MTRLVDTEGELLLGDSFSGAEGSWDASIYPDGEILISVPLALLDIDGNVLYNSGGVLCVRLKDILDEYLKNINDDEFSCDGTLPNLLTEYAAKLNAINKK